MLRLQDKKTFWQLILRLVPGFVADDFNTPLLRLLWLYAIRSEEFEQTRDEEGDLMGYSLDKGLLIYGNVGCGKTELLRCLQKYLQLLDSPLQFGVVPLKEIAEEFAADGYQAFHRRSNKVEHWLFDDLGQTDKETVANYANRVNIAENVILARYERYRTGTLSHFTTNMSFEELQQHYDGRVWSRLTEMCNLVMLTGPDRRPQAQPKVKHRPKPQAAPVPAYTDDMKLETVRQVVEHLKAGGDYRFADYGGLIYEFLKKRRLITAEMYEEVEAQEMHWILSNVHYRDLDSASRKEFKRFEDAEEPPADNRYTKELAHRCEKALLRQCLERLASGELEV